MLDIRRIANIPTTPLDTIPIQPSELKMGDQGSRRARWLVSAPTQHVRRSPNRGAHAFIRQSLPADLTPRDLPSQAFGRLSTSLALNNQAASAQQALERPRGHRTYTFPGGNNSHQGPG